MTQNVGNLTVGSHVGAPIGLNTNPTAPNQGSQDAGTNYGTEIGTHCNVGKAINNPIPINVVGQEPVIQNDETTAYFIGNCYNAGYIGIDIEGVCALTDDNNSALIVANSSQSTQTIVIFRPVGVDITPIVFNNIALNSSGDYVTFSLAPNRSLFIGKKYILHL